jgi:hypothetical protein
MSRPSISRTRSKANLRRRNRQTTRRTHHERKIEAEKKRRNPAAEKKRRIKERAHLAEETRNGSKKTRGSTAPPQLDFRGATTEHRQEHVGSVKWRWYGPIVKC